MIEVEVHNRILTIAIRRPEARNAINAEVAIGIEQGLDRLEGDSNLWIGVITGRGGVFSAGADLKAVAAGEFDSIFTARGGFAGIGRRERVKPLIAAVEGPALAGGCEIALSCDLIVASRSASFGIPEVKRSLIAASGGLFRLPRAIPANVAMEMALTGDPIGAERAYQLGLVNELVDEGNALDAALELANRIVANAPVAVQESRALVRLAAGFEEEELWEYTDEAMMRVAATQDFLEGPLAFIERRDPHWRAH